MQISIMLWYLNQHLVSHDGKMPLITSAFVSDLASQWPPCIRIIVQASLNLELGTLFIVTCTGAKIGRDKENSVFIPDTQVSKVCQQLLT